MSTREVQHPHNNETDRSVGPTYTFGPFRLMATQRVLEKSGISVAIRSRAFDLLCVLVQNAGHVMSNRDLIAAVWPDAVVEENNLRVQLGTIRRFLGEWRDGKAYIENVPLRGYCFVAPVFKEGERGAQLMVHAASIRPQAPRHNLPGRLSQVIGRDVAVASLRAALCSQRLVTLVGTGGIGKTTVAIAVAEAVSAVCADGARFVDFSSLSDDAQVVGTLAAVVDVPVLSDDPTDAVMNWIADKDMLVVMDNCEHVIDAAATLAEKLMRHAPFVRVLVTSREPLRVVDEWLYRLEPLGSPPAPVSTTMNAALAFPAVELFVARARFSKPDIVFSDADALTITQICHHLDGLPLAIELAAARVDMFGLRGLAVQMENRLQLLGQGRRSLLPRHQTLRAALDWSHALLSDLEQQALRNLAVLRGRFDMNAACSVIDAEANDCVDAIANLVSKSLISADPGDDSGVYRLLETTRSYAYERLVHSGELSDVSARHAQWCLKELDNAALEMKSLDPAQWRARYVRRIDDVREAIEWTWADVKSSVGPRLVAGATAIWFSLGWLKECLSKLVQAQAVLPAEALGTSLELRLQVAYAHCTMLLTGPCEEVDAALARAKEIATFGTDPRLVLAVTWTRFIRNIICADYKASLEEGEHFGRAALEAFDEEAVYVHHRMMALSLHFLGDQPLAYMHIEKALNPAAMASLELQHGTPQQSDHRTTSLTHLARILCLQGDTGQAIEIAEEAYQSALRTGHALPAVYALSYACCPVSLWMGDLASAERYTSLLMDMTRRHSLAFWHVWSRMYQSVLAAAVAGDRKLALDLSGLSQGHRDMLATLDVGFLPADGLERVNRGQSSWCTAEMLRTQGESLLQGEVPDVAGAQSLLERALNIALSQGAMAWALRAASSMVRLGKFQGDASAAKMRLCAVLQHFDTGSESADLLAARQLVATCSGNVPLALGKL